MISVFNTNVINAVKANTYHLNNIPTCVGYQCVPSNIMDRLDSLPTLHEVGVVDGKIEAKSVVDAMVDVTRNLTRVGTFSYVVRMRTTDRYGQTGYRTLGSASGKVIFTADYIRELNPPVNPGNVVVDQPITIASINALCAACLSSWNSTSKYHYSNTLTLCHESCHSNCHQDCHRSCKSDCYVD